MIDEEEITVKLVMDKIEQNTHDQSHYKKNYTKQRNQTKKRITENEKWNGLKNTHTKLCFSAEHKIEYPNIIVR